MSTSNTEHAQGVLLDYSGHCLYENDRHRVGLKHFLAATQASMVMLPVALPEGASSEHAAPYQLAQIDRSSIISANTVALA